MGHLGQGTRVRLWLTSSWHVGNVDSIPGSGRSPGGGNGNPLQYSHLENSVDTGAWRATVCRVARESDATKAT